MAKAPYSKNVFVNCPFDERYAPLLDAIVFTIHDCGFVARSALEIDDSSRVRIDKIFQIMSECKFGVHDVSRTQRDESTGLPRFNMPLELGMFLGAKRFGDRRQRGKVCLILDEDRHRYQKFISDIAGQDIKSHAGDEKRAIKVVRDWLRNSMKGSGIRLPSGSRMADRYRLFLTELPRMCKELDLKVDELLFNEYTDLVVGWLDANRW